MSSARFRILLVAMSVVAPGRAHGQPDEAAAKDEAGATEGEDDDEPLTGTFEVTARGMLVVNTAWSSRRLIPGDFALYVAPPAFTGHQFALSPANTVVGFKAEGVSYRSWQLEGALDLTLKSPRPEARTVLEPLFYDIHVAARGEDAYVLLGQYPDLMLPFTAASINGFPGSYIAGSIGFFRPQIRAGGRLHLADAVEVQLHAGIARDVLNFQIAPLIIGGGAGVPDGQGRMILAAGEPTPEPGHPWQRRYELGVTGHLGQRAFAQVDAVGSPIEILKRTTWSIQGFLRAALPTGTTLRARVWRGRTLGDVQAGIFQSVSGNNLEAISAHGGWIDVRQTLGPHWHVAAGYGRDDPRDSELAAGQRALNQTLFGNVFWQWSRTLSFAAEVSYWSTRWKGLGDADTWRGEINTAIRF